MSVKKINISGNEYDIKDANAQAMISDEFDSGTPYTTGDYCIYKNVLYKFTSDKSAGAWDSGKVVATNIDTELSSLNSRLPKGKERIVFQSITGAGTIPIPNYNSYKALVAVMYGDGNNGNPIFIPQQMYDVDVPFSISSDNEQRGSFTVCVQGKILNGNVDISYCKTTGWSNATLVVYGIS